MIDGLSPVDEDARFQIYGILDEGEYVIHRGKVLKWALDYVNAENTVNLYRRLREEKGLTILIVTHDQEIADRCDRIIHISYGEIEKQGVSL